MWRWPEFADGVVRVVCGCRCAQSGQDSFTLGIIVGHEISTSYGRIAREVRVRCDILSTGAWDRAPIP